MEKLIHNYDNIQVQPNSLVVMDIDFTVIKFELLHKSWWVDTKRNYETKYGKKLAEEYALKEWTRLITLDKAYLIDPASFQKLLTRIEETNSRLIFITARDESLHDLTVRQLRESGLTDIDPDTIYYSYPKGKKLLDVYTEKYSHLQKIIFVDDGMDNLEDVKKYIPDCDLYLFSV